MADLTGMATPEAQRLMLEIMFTGVEAPKELWVGLCRRTVSDRVDLKLLTSLEPRSAPGYRRQRLEPRDWQLEGDGQVSSRVLRFSNSGNEPWPVMDISFLATSEDASGILLAWTWLPQGHALFREEVLLLPWQVRMVSSAG